MIHFRSFQSRREISRLCARGRGSLHTRSCYMQQHTAEMAERKRSEVWLNVTRLDVDNARCQRCNKSLACQGGNTSNLFKHLAKVHHIQTEECTGFDCLSSSSVAPYLPFPRQVCYVCLNLPPEEPLGLAAYLYLYAPPVLLCTTVFLQ